MYRSIRKSYFSYHILCYSSRKITREQKLILFLVKLRLNVTFTVLGAMFCIADGTAGHWFYCVLRAMVEVAKHGVCWFDREQIRARMPRSFKELYPATRCIIDCTEIFVQKPGSQRQQVQVGFIFFYAFSSF